jgi:hypothetical protein
MTPNATEYGLTAGLAFSADEQQFHTTATAAADTRTRCGQFLAKLAVLCAPLEAGHRAMSDRN